MHCCFTLSGFLLVYVCVFYHCSFLDLYLCSIPLPPTPSRSPPPPPPPKIQTAVLYPFLNIRHKKHKSYIHSSHPPPLAFWLEGEDDMKKGR